MTKEQALYAVKKYDNKVNSVNEYPDYFDVFYKKNGLVYDHSWVVIKNSGKIITMAEYLMRKVN